MSNDNAYALLVGVGDYAAFDPSGRADLKGPPHDVAAWLHMMRDLGVPPSQIMICVSPRMPFYVPPAHTRDVQFSGTSKAELCAALGWLVKQLDENQAAKAVLTWSGHGTRTDAGQILCPSDIEARGGVLSNALPVTEVAAILSARSRARITAFIDTCHNDTGFTDAVGTARSRALPWQGATTKVVPGEGATHDVFGDLVMSSSEVGHVSYEVPVIGGVRGAFSWAASNLIHRYGLVDGVEGTTSGLTFNALARLSPDILKGMLVEQRPRFLGSHEAGEQRVFSALGDVGGPRPPQRLPGQEIWPGVGEGEVLNATLKTSSGATLGTVYVTGDVGSKSHGWTSNRQYWAWTNGAWPTTSFETGTPSLTPTDQISVPSSPLIYQENGLTPTRGSQNMKDAFGVATSSGGAPTGYIFASTDQVTAYGVLNNGKSSLLDSATTPAYFIRQTSDYTRTYYSMATDPKA